MVKNGLPLLGVGMRELKNPPSKIFSPSFPGVNRCEKPDSIKKLIVDILLLNTGAYNLLVLAVGNRSLCLISL